MTGHPQHYPNTREQPKTITVVEYHEDCRVSYECHLPWLLIEPETVEWT